MMFGICGSVLESCFPHGLRSSYTSTRPIVWAVRRAAQVTATLADMLRVFTTVLSLSMMCWSHQISSHHGSWCPAPSFSLGPRNIAWSDTTCGASAGNDRIEISVGGSDGPIFSPTSVQAAPGATIQFISSDAEIRIYGWGAQDPCGSDGPPSPTAVPREAGGTVSIRVQSSGPSYFSTSSNRDLVCDRKLMFAVNPSSFAFNPSSSALDPSSSALDPISSALDPSSFALDPSSFALNPSSHMSGSMPSESVKPTRSYLYRPTSACWNRHTSLPHTRASTGIAGTNKLPGAPSASSSGRNASLHGPIEPQISNSGRRVTTAVSLFVVAASLSALMYGV